MTSEGTLGSSPAMARASASGVAALGSTGMNDSIALAIEGRPSTQTMSSRAGCAGSKHVTVVISTAPWLVNTHCPR